MFAHTLHIIHSLNLQLCFSFRLSTFWRLCISKKMFFLRQYFLNHENSFPYENSLNKNLWEIFKWNWNMTKMWIKVETLLKYVEPDRMFTGSLRRRGRNFQTLGYLCVRISWIQFSRTSTLVPYTRGTKKGGSYSFGVHANPCRKFLTLDATSLISAQVSPRKRVELFPLFRWKTLVPLPLTLSTKQRQERSWNSSICQRRWENTR